MNNYFFSTLLTLATYTIYTKFKFNTCTVEFVALAIGVSHYLTPSAISREKSSNEHSLDSVD